jgi:hypothetical protein
VSQISSSLRTVQRWNSWTVLCSMQGRVPECFQHFWGKSVIDNARSGRPRTSDGKIRCVDMCILTGFHMATRETNWNILWLCETNGSKTSLTQTKPKSRPSKCKDTITAFRDIIRCHQHQFLPSVTTATADYYSSSLLQRVVILQQIRPKSNKHSSEYWMPLFQYRSAQTHLLLISSSVVSQWDGGGLNTMTLRDSSFIFDKWRK